MWAVRAQRTRHNYVYQHGPHTRPHPKHCLALGWTRIVDFAAGTRNGDNPANNNFIISQMDGTLDLRYAQVTSPLRAHLSAFGTYIIRHF